MRSENPSKSSLHTSRSTSGGRDFDSTLSWISQERPELEQWRELGLGWLSRLPSFSRMHLSAIVRFLDRYLVQRNLPLDPAILLRTDTLLPDFFEAECPKSRYGALMNNSARLFLDDVLRERFLQNQDKIGNKKSSIYHNPIEKRDLKTFRKIPIRKSEGIWRDQDPTLDWIITDYPQLADWQKLGLGWLETLPRTSRSQLKGILRFLKDYMIQFKLPLDPDEFLRRKTQLPDFFKEVCPESRSGVALNNTVRSFLNWVLLEHFSETDSTGRITIRSAYHNPIPKRDIRTFHTIPDLKGIRRGYDKTFTWIQLEHSQMEPWRVLAAEWIQGIPRGVPIRMNALVSFLDRYIVGLGLPRDPVVILSRSTRLPDFYRTVCPQSIGGIKVNNHVHEFLDFVLLKLCCEPDDHGRPVVSPAFWNPIPKLTGSGFPQRYESVHSPLPYGYIDSLRRILVGGPNFRDWAWAQAALGAEEGKCGTPGPDWFQVTWNDIDKDDPDCVWRIRKRIQTHGNILEMWSPVRWVALLIKLILPLRTFQVQMLDSGEADTYRYEAGGWLENPGRLRQGRPGKSHHQGVFQRVIGSDERITTQLYINTNKTADAAKTGSDKGFALPWPVLGDETGNPFYWLEKLRNWQEKFNPIDRLARWSELSSVHLGGNVKSEMQLAAYLDTAFLFRMRESKPSERQLPLKVNTLNRPWYELLHALEDRLKAGEITQAHGSPVCLVPVWEESNEGNTTHFPLHCLRVSLITALAQDGEMRPELVMKIVGHSRLLMTLYYTRFGESFIRLKLEEALVRLENKKDASILHFLADTEHAELLRKVIGNSPESIKVAIPVHCGSRNPAEWELMADGACLMGGNTSPMEANTKVGGCFNGGALVEGAKSLGCGPVPGGTRNCVRCRWFVTMPHHLFALQARFNNIAYREFEARVEVQDRAMELQQIENSRYDAEKAKVPFGRANELRQAMRLQESAMARWQDLVLDLSACQSLVMRCIQALEAGVDGSSIVSTGLAADLKCTLEETDSELLQLAGVCEDLEIYGDLPPLRDAVFRRSQWLDAALQNANHLPLFLHLPMQVQLRAGNAWLKAMAKISNPADPELGKRKVISLIESRERLFTELGFDLTECLPDELRDFQPPKPVKVASKNTEPRYMKGGRRNVLHHDHSS